MGGPILLRLVSLRDVGTPTCRRDPSWQKRLIPAAPAPDRWVRGATRGPRALIGGVADRRRGDDGGDHATGAGRGRPAAGGGPVPGRAGGAADARPGAGAGRGLAGGGGAGGRHGTADPSRLGGSGQTGGGRPPAP